MCVLSEHRFLCLLRFCISKKKYDTTWNGVPCARLTRSDFTITRQKIVRRRLSSADVIKAILMPRICGVARQTDAWIKSRAAKGYDNVVKSTNTGRCGGLHIFVFQKSCVKENCRLQRKFLQEKTLLYAIFASICGFSGIYCYLNFFRAGYSRAS